MMTFLLLCRRQAAQLGDPMKRLSILVCVLVLLGGIAHSQEIQGGDNPNTIAARQDAERIKAEREQKKQRELDAAYKATLDKKKAPAAPVDPWGAVRPAK
jgi:hypothetical protein